MPSWFHDYEVWTTTAGGRPTLAVLGFVWIALVAVHLPSIKHWAKSVQAFVAFALVNIFVWHWSWWGRGLVTDSPRRAPVPETGWALHVTTMMIHLLIITGVGLIVALFGKYVLGWEDEPTNGERVWTERAGNDRRDGWGKRDS